MAMLGRMQALKCLDFQTVAIMRAMRTHILQRCADLRSYLYNMFCLHPYVSHPVHCINQC